MRIISGKFKGRRLVGFDNDNVRPMTDRVKESLFNILSVQVYEANVLDLYCGTGNLGLEALSREAKAVTFVDKSQRSLNVLKRNLEELDIKEGFKIIKKDAIEFLNKNQEGFDLLLIDPPFPLKIGLATLEAVSQNTLCLNPGARLAIETSSRELLPERIGRLRNIDTRHYGDKILHFYSLEES